MENPTGRFSTITADKPIQKESRSRKRKFIMKYKIIIQSRQHNEIY